jgi:hypothetical protein
MAYLVYIADASGQSAEEIEKQLVTAAAESKVFNKYSDLAESLEKNLPDLVLFNASLLAENEVNPELFSKVPVMVYARDIDIEKRSELYSQGVKRIIIEQENLALHAAAAAKMILYRRDKLRRSRQSSVTYGTLQAFSLQEILKNALLEKKNLIIKVRYKDRDIKLRTFQGHVVNAFATHLSNEDAILKVMQFPSGAYVIRGYQKLDEYSPMSSSTLAILAEAKFEQNEIRRFLEVFGGGSGNPAFQEVQTKKHNGLPSEKSETLELVNAHRTFHDILLQSHLPVLKTVRALTSLATRGFIVLAGEGETVETFQPRDIEYIRKELLSESARSGNLVILGMPGTGRSVLIRTLAGMEKGSIKSVRSVDFVRINLQSDLILTTFGISVDKNLLSILERISQSMLACIFLVDYRQKDQFEFLNYLYNRIVQIYPVPFVLGVTNIEGEPEKALKEVRTKFTLPDRIEFLPVNSESFGDVRNLIYKLRKVAVEIEEGN